jgi:hypothetical protein
MNWSNSLRNQLASLTTVAVALSQVAPQASNIASNAFYLTAYFAISVTAPSIALTTLSFSHLIVD